MVDTKEIAKRLAGGHMELEDRIERELKAMYRIGQTDMKHRAMNLLLAHATKLQEGGPISIVSPEATSLRSHAASIGQLELKDEC